MGDMTKADRHELRQVIKSQFAVLRSEVAERAGELLVELEVEIEERFRAERHRRRAVEDRVAAIFEAASREATDVLVGEDVGITVNQPFRVRLTAIPWPDDGSQRMRMTGRATIDARVRQARLKLERQEADLLRSLAVDAIESDAAQRFLANIPSVGELVPAPRLAELEANIKEET